MTKSNEPIPLKTVAELKNPAVEEVQAAIQEFAETCKEHGMTSILLIAMSPGHRFATRTVAAPLDQLKLMGLVDVIKADMTSEFLDLMD